MAEHIGRRFGNYQLQRLIGHGGFADVYLGEHVYMGTQAAIKLLHTQLGDKDGERFLQEARTVARMEHPNIIRVLEFGVEESIPFLVLSYAPNGTLRDRHPKGTVLPLSKVVEYTLQLTDALQYAHDEKIIHRDIKPENMLTGRRGEILLTDFGIALVMQNSRSASVKDLAGTAAYMAPEQIEAHPRPASDQYSLGIVIYEWLSGAYPFQGTFAEIALKHTISPVPPLRQKVPNLPAAVEEVINTALAKDPNKRFGSVSAFARALEQASRSVPNPITPFPIPSTDSPTVLSAPPRMLTPSQQHISQQPISQQPAIQQPISQQHISQQPISQQPISQQPISQQPAIQQPISQQPAIQQPIALPGVEHSGGFANPYTSTEQTVLTPHTPPPGMLPTVPQTQQARPGEIPSENLLSQPRVTEIPAQLPRTFLRRNILLGGLGGLVALTGAGAFAAWWATSHQQPAPTPTPTPMPTPAPYIYYGHESYVFSVAWSPDGKRIASASNDKTVKVWDALTGAHPYTYYGHKSTVFGVAWSPDGKRIASASLDKTAQVWDATPGAKPYAYIYRGHSDWVNDVAWSPDGKFIASAGRDKTVQVWDAVTGTALYTYRGHWDSVQQVAWSPNGKLIASVGRDKTAQVWDAATGTMIFTYHGHTDVVFAVTWSPDSTRVASASGDKTVQVWDALTGAHPYTYRGHSAWVQAVAWSPNGKRIASAGGDSTVQTWNASTGAHIYTYRGHTNWIYGLAWSPDSSRVASGSFDKTVQVWHTS